MQKINLTIELNKINKDKIETRTFKTKDGEEVTVKEYKCDLVPLKEKKFVTQGETPKGIWTLFKTHFIVEKKGNKDDDDEDVYVGNGFQFEFPDDKPKEVSEDINPDDIPF